MTKAKKFKGKVRDRAARNGESFSTARMHVDGGGEPPESPKPNVNLYRADEKLITMTLSERHWIVVLAAIEKLIPGSLRAIDDLREKGVKPEDVSDADSAAMAGPLVVRGILVKELTAHRVLKPEANERMGLDNLLAKLRNPPPKP